MLISKNRLCVLILFYATVSCVLDDAMGLNNRKIQKSCTLGSRISKKPKIRPAAAYESRTTESASCTLGSLIPKILKKPKKTPAASYELRTTESASTPSETKPAIVTTSSNELKSTTPTIKLQSASRITKSTSATRTANSAYKKVILPTQSDTFERIRQNREIVFVDKSHYLKQFLSSRQIFYFISRPRRFGKSLFAQMVAAFFGGRKQLFEGLAIYTRGNGAKEGKWIDHPVIYLDFSTILTFDTAQQFRERYQQDISDTLDLYGVPPKEPFGLCNRIKHLMRKCQNQSVVIVIDEYDAPVRTALEDSKPALAKEVLNEMKKLLTEIKGCNDYLRFVYVTGVAKLALVGIASGANNFEDISYDERFAGAMGFLPDELNKFESYFGSYLKKKKNDFTVLSQEMMDWYNGYTFSKRLTPKVMNPVSVIECFRNQEAQNYWTKTGEMNTLINRFKVGNLPWDYYGNYRIKPNKLFAPLDIIRDVIPLPIELFTYGYLTLKKYDKNTGEYLLDYPNNEIRDAIQCEFISKADRDDHPNLVRKYPINEDFSLRDAFEKADITKVVDIINDNINDIKATDQNITEDSLTSFLILYFKHNHVSCNGTTQMYKGKRNEGDIDLQTTSFRPNFIIEIKRTVNGTYKIVDKFIQYSKLASFRTAFGNQDKVNLLGFNFDHDKSKPYRILDWVMIPYVYNPNGSSLRLNETQSSIPELKEKYLSSD